jgi:hypothetical protein
LTIYDTMSANSDVIGLAREDEMSLTRIFAGIWSRLRKVIIDACTSKQSRSRLKIKRDILFKNDSSGEISSRGQVHDSPACSRAFIYARLQGDPVISPPISLSSPHAGIK